MSFILKVKITSADESLRQKTPKNRNSLFDNERKLKYYLKYSKQNCIDECLSHLVFEICVCLDFYFIRKFYVRSRINNKYSKV